MNTFFTRLKKETQKIRLSVKERETMRFALEDAMRTHTLVKSPVRMIPSPFLFFGPRLISPFAFVLVLAVVGGSTAYAAEGAVPGDLLYPIKVALNEPVRVAFAVSSESKAEVHVRLAERRMQEAEILAARGTITSDVKTTLAERFEKHAQAVEEAVAIVEQRDLITAADISARFGSSLSAHSAVIARLGAKGSDENRRESESLSHSFSERGRRLARAEAITSAVRQDARTLNAPTASAPAAEATLSMKVSSSDADAAIIARIELTTSTTIEEAEAYLAALKDKLDATTSARARAQISNIRAFIQKLRQQNGEFSDKERVKRALHDAVTIKTFIEAQEKFFDHVLLPAPDIGEGVVDEE